MNIFYIFLGLLVGVHVVSYGAYKDSPYENFIYRRVVREIVISILITSIIAVFSPSSLIGNKLYITFAFVLIFSRIVTEMYKLFIRREDQSHYKIPSQVHILGSIPDNQLYRLAVSIVVPLFILIALLVAWLIHSLISPIYLKGFLTGLTGGALIAIGGSYKDGFFEGFSMVKFFRSPVVTAIWAIFLATKIANPYLLMLVAMGFERMTVELYKGFFLSGYVPGKFKFKKAVFPQWLAKRRIFIYPYAFTWIVVLFFIVLDI